MKRTILFAMMASCAIALISAQGYVDGQGQQSGQRQRRNPEGQGQLQRRYDNSRGGGNERRYEAVPRQRRSNDQFSRQQPASASVSGNLSLVQGRIAVTDGDTTYIIRGLNRFIGFIDGLKEGAAVTLEGYAFTRAQKDSNESVKFLSVQKMNLNGKEYDLGRPSPDFQNQRHRQMPQNPMPRRQMPSRQSPRQMPQKMHRGR